MKRRHCFVHHDVHVSPAVIEEGWKVTRHGRIVSRHRTQHNAIRAGRRLARRVRVELITHGVDGRFRSKDTYGHETEVHDTEH